MFKIIGIVVSLILGAFVGRIACNIMNKEKFTINPMICTIVGIVGGALGSWLVSAFGLVGGFKLVLLQLVSGIAFAAFLLLFASFARDKEEEPFPFDDDDEEEPASSK